MFKKENSTSERQEQTVVGLILPNEGNRMLEIFMLKILCKG